MFYIKIIFNISQLILLIKIVNVISYYARGFRMNKDIENNIDITINNLIKQDEHVSNLKLSEKIVLPSLEQSKNEREHEIVSEFQEKALVSDSKINPSEDTNKKELINDFIFSTLLKLDIYNDYDMYDALKARDNLFLNENDLISLIRKTLSFQTNKSFNFLLKHEKKLPSSAINLLSDILDEKNRNNDDNLINYERFLMILDKIDKKYFYVADLEKLFVSILQSGLSWPIILVSKKIKFNKIPDLFNIVCTLLNNFKSLNLNQQATIEHNDFAISLCSKLLKKSCCLKRIQFVFAK